MKSLRKTALLLGAATVAVAAVPLLARTHQQSSAKPAQAQPPPPQQPQQQTQQQPRLVVPVNQVLVPVTVKDRSGNLVPDLNKGDFRIFEDNVEQRILYFSAEPVPLSMVLLIDNDLKRNDARQVQDSLDAVVAGLSASDEAYVCRFDQFFHEGKGFVSDQDRLLTELKRTRLSEETSAGPSSSAITESPTINGHAATGDAPKPAETTLNIQGQSTKALDDAVYGAAQLLRDRDPERKRRKIILLISDGANNPKVNTHKYGAVIQEVLRYNIAVYGVGVGSAVFNRKFERLSKYAHDSGGDVYYGLKREDIEEFYSRVTEEARNQYTLAYTPAGTDRSADYHQIEVRVERPGLNILTREGYYAGSAR